MIQKSQSHNLIAYGAVIITVLALLPWLSAYWVNAINVDIAFLTLSAERFLSGDIMSEAYYDTNPPLSILIQIPAVLIEKLTPLPLYHAVSVYIIGLLCLSFALTYALLKRFETLSALDRALILSGFLVMNTIGAGYDFGQKDHLLGIALFPFALLQILITKRAHTPPTLKYVTLCFGSLFILLKPHYGLIPAAIFIHRAIKQKRLSVCFDIDFIFLSIFAASYVGLIYFMFNDFLTIIVPDILMYYSTAIDMGIIQTGAIVFVICLCGALVSQYLIKTPPPLAPALLLIGGLCMVPFILQGKGWFYHMLPALIFITCSVSVLAKHLLYKICADIKNTTAREIIAFVIIFGCILSLPILSITNKTQRITHDNYMNTDIARIINDCAQPCSFLMLNDMINMPHELSVYTGARHASRFPVLWFTPSLLFAQHQIDNGESTNLSQDDINQGRDKYARMIADDFKTYNPDLIFIPHLPHPFIEGASFTYKDDMLSSHPDLFKPIWDDYELDQTLDVDRLDYMPAKKPNEGLIRYDIYRKKNVQ